MPPRPSHRQWAELRDARLCRQEEAHKARRVFLAEMAAAMLCSVLEAVTAQHYLKGSDGNELLHADRVRSVVERGQKAVTSASTWPVWPTIACRGQRVERRQPPVPLMMRVIGRSRRRGALCRSNSA
jgi:hypothetical protein